MEVERVTTGWVAWEDGLAGRGATREEAVEQYRAVRALVTRLADKWRENRRRVEGRATLVGQAASLDDPDRVTTGEPRDG